MPVAHSIRQSFAPEGFVGALVRSYASAGFAFAFSLILFFILKYDVIASPPFSYFLNSPNPSTFLVRVAIILLLAAAASGIRMSALEVPVQRFLRVLIPVITLYVFTAGPVTVPTGLGYETEMACLIALAWAAPVFAVLAWWRPAFMLPLVALLLWQKLWLPFMNDGYVVSPTDYMPLFDTALLVVVAVGTLRLLGTFKWWRKLEQFRIANNTITPLMFIFMGVIAIHLGNYFHSGTAKIFLDGGPLSWVLENRTDMLSHVTWELGFLPLAAWPALAALVLAVMVPPMVQILNVLTLVPQLLCPLVVFSRRLLIITLLFFDVQHIVIYLLTGIAFWKWVALNTAFVIALAQWEKARTPWPLSLAMIFLSTVVLVLPEVRMPSFLHQPSGHRLIERGQPFFFTARLGWYDSPAANHTYLTAVLQDGRELRVPTNYFMSYSILVAQQRMAAYSGNLWPTGTWGATGKYEIMKGGLACNLPLTTEPENLDERENFIHFVKQRHAYALSRADENGNLAYDLYPHHVWSNPLLYREFAAVDLRQIKYFRLNYDALCVDWSGGERRTKLVTHQSIDISLD